jgi:aminopeptidase-like protein
MPLKPILEKIYPLHRTLASEGLDEALEIVGEHMPEGMNYAIETYRPGDPAWTWKVPERYLVHEAYLESQDGRRWVDFADNPLHIVSYSLPTDLEMSWDDLEAHLFYNEERPHSIPWVFKYYDRDWGFCLAKEVFDQLPRDQRYRAVIRSEFVNEPGFRVSVAAEAGSHGEILLCAHICHPMQANDDAAGVVTLIGVAQRLAANPLPEGSLGVRFLFCPETIGSIAYLAHNEDLIPRFKAGIFAEMTGNRGPLAWHHSRQHNHLIDRITARVLSEDEPVERNFADFPPNDERVINGPGVNVPCISINRWPYDEYHTTDDNPGIIDETMLQEAADRIEKIVRIFASNYTPLRTFKGPVFLSGHGLWVDYRENWALNRAIEKIMMCFEGEHTIFDIAEEVGLDYWTVHDYVEKFRAKGFVNIQTATEHSGEIR